MHPFSPCLIAKAKEAVGEAAPDKVCDRDISRGARSRSDCASLRQSPEVIRLLVVTYVGCPLSLRNVKDLLFKRGIDIAHETVRMNERPFPGGAQVSLNVRVWVLAARPANEANVCFARSDVRKLPDRSRPSFSRNG